MMSIIIPCKNEPDITSMMLETEKYCPEARIIVASDRYGRGKGWALRFGLEEAQGDIICFIDGDLDINPLYIDYLYTYIKSDKADIVVGKKYISHCPLSRRIVSKCARLFIWLLFRLPFDTQTGIKVFRRDALPDWEENGFAFDLEILYKAHKAGKRILEVEVPVTIRKKMPTRSIIKFIIQAIKIRWRLRA